MKLRIGSRESRLAVVQAELLVEAIRAAHPEVELELVTMKTTGDKILDRTLDKVGGKGLFVKELDKAIQYMSKRRIGALITLEQKTGLEEYVETGIKLDALVTGELLINIFIPNTPLHDGAVIIKNNRVQVASAYLPLSDNAMIPKSLGTRHRAAVGISEVTDAITVVVSEETGGVTITRNGQFMVDLSQQEYLKYLRAELVTEEKRKQPWPIRLARGIWNWGDK